MTITFVQCKVSLGFFGSEFYVIVGDSSAFVDKQSVRIKDTPKTGEEVDGTVMAYVVMEESDKALVELPGQAVVGGLRTWVPKNSLAAA